MSREAEGLLHKLAEANQHLTKIYEWQVDENIRLRNVLRKVSCSCWPEPGCSKGRDCKEFIARTALEGESDD